jgi:hypothetical protein
MSARRGSDSNRAERIFADAAMDVTFAASGYVVHPFLGAAEMRAMEQLHAEMFPETDADFSATILNDSTESPVRTSRTIRAIVEAPLRRILGRHRLAVATFVTKSVLDEEFSLSVSMPAGPRSSTTSACFMARTRTGRITFVWRSTAS